jgi:hypothetical protein
MRAGIRSGDLASRVIRDDEPAGRNKRGGLAAASLHRTVYA